MLLSERSVRRPVLTSMIFGVVIAIGMFSFTALGLDLIPDIEFPFLVIWGQYSGTGPEEMEETVGQYLEKAASQVNGVKKMSTIASEGQVVVSVEFDWGTDTAEAANDLRAKIDMIGEYLPEDMKDPMILKFDASMIPIYMFMVSSDMEQRELNDFVNEKISDPLSQVNGVGNITVYGAAERKIYINCNRKQLSALGITIQDVIRAIRMANVNLPGGKIRTGEKTYIVRTEGKFATPDELNSIFIKRAGANMRTGAAGTPIYLRDIAKIEDSYDKDKPIARGNGQPCLFLVVQKQAGQNTVQVTKRFKKKLDSIKSELGIYDEKTKKRLIEQEGYSPEDVESKVIIREFWNQGETIMESLQRVRNVGLFGAIIAFFVLLFFLRDLKSTLIIVTAIPISIIATFIFMRFFNVTLNTISLSGLAIGIGMLVDNSIVVLENIYRFRERGANPYDAAVIGAGEVASAIVASTLTTICVFIPILLAEQSMATVFFREIALTIISALFTSLVVALTLVPMMAARLIDVIDFAKQKQKWPLWGRVITWGDIVLTKIDTWYSRVVQWTLKNRGLVMLACISFFIISLLLLILVVPKENMPEGDSENFVLSVEMAPGTPIERMDEMSRFIKARILSNAMLKKNIRTLTELIGSKEGGPGGADAQASHYASLYFKAVSQKKRRGISTTDMLNAIRDSIKNIPGIKFDTIVFGSMGGADNGQNVNVQIFGYDLEIANQLAEEVMKIMRGMDELADVRKSRDDGLPEFVVDIDHNRLSSMELDAYSVAMNVQGGFQGKTAAFYTDEKGEQIDIIVRLREADRNAVDDLQQMVIANFAGKSGAVANLASVKRNIGPVSITREDKRRIINVLAGFTSDNPDVGGLSREVLRKINDEIVIPPGFEIKLSGSFADMQENFAQLGLALLIAIILVYMVMAAQFESLVEPFIIMFSIPMALIGVVGIILLTFTTFSLVSFIGMIMLAGIVVNNAIVLVDYANILRARGMDMNEALITAGRTRIRPILMTTTTTVMGLIPMAIGFGEGSEMWAPLARAVVGGLAISTIFTLVLVPTAYSLVTTMWERFTARFSKGKKKLSF